MEGAGAGGRCIDIDGDIIQRTGDVYGSGREDIAVEPGFFHLGSCGQTFHIPEINADLQGRILEPLHHKSSLDSAGALVAVLEGQACEIEAVLAD